MTTALSIPTDTPPPASSPGPDDIVDTAPIITPQQREKDFNKLFTWRGKEITFSIASELYYRELRMHMNAPPLNSYVYMADFAAEASRVLYCCHFNAAQLRALRMLDPKEQIERYDAWAEANIAFHELDRAAEVAQQINDTIARARTQPMETGDPIDSLGNSPARP